MPRHVTDAASAFPEAMLQPHPPNGCASCEYKQMPHGGGGHCYMFQTEPSPCMIHKPVGVAASDRPRPKRLLLGHAGVIATILAAETASRGEK